MVKRAERSAPQDITVSWIYISESSLPSTSYRQMILSAAP
jgi:hypothetical protein